ncbi:hypothetical protein RRG08_013711 [Elysia crispata]|uniref:Uncharacterized protein n=1 Tax=Elysia crispata TaxID=231223 RepID=A0AAE1DBT1_9GAST|nr:hypothetical protein RRG08_013711 [Elysia crispata]
MSTRTRVTSPAVDCCSQIVCLSVHFSVCRDYADQYEYPSHVPCSGVRLCVCLFISLFAVTTLSLNTRVTSPAVDCCSQIVCLSVHLSVCRDYADQYEYPCHVPAVGCCSQIVCLSVHLSVCRDYAEQYEYPCHVPCSGLL